MRTVRTLRILGAAALTAAVVLPIRDASGQEVPASFEAVASADGIRVLLEVPGAPLSSNLFDGGAPVTQAKVNGLGESVAYASMPYPGENASTLPNMVLPLLGLPALPSYPLTARSETGTAPEAAVGEGPLRLEAESTPRRSAARSSSGGGADVVSVGLITTGAEAALADGGGISSKATSTVEAFTVPGQLRIGAVESTASAEQAGDGAPTTSSSLTAEGVTVAGVTIGVDRDGITLPGQKAPVPDTTGLSPVLDGAGITLRYLEPVPTEGGVISAGLAITVPVPNPAGQPATATYILGRTAATVHAAFAPAAPPLAPLAPTVGGAPASPGAAVPPPADLAPATPPDLGASLPDAGTVEPSPDAAPPTPGGRIAAPQVAGAVAPAASTAATVFYLVLALGGLVALSGSFLVRTIGVRLQWTR